MFIYPLYLCEMAYCFAIGCFSSIKIVIFNFPVPTFGSSDRVHVSCSSSPLLKDIFTGTRVFDFAQCGQMICPLLKTVKYVFSLSDKPCLTGDFGTCKIYFQLKYETVPMLNDKGLHQASWVTYLHDVHAARYAFQAPVLGISQTFRYLKNQLK